MKFHDDRCKGKAVMRRKPFSVIYALYADDRRTDGQTDMVIPVYPPNFVAGGIKMIVCSGNKFHDLDYDVIRQWIHLNVMCQP